MPPNTYSTSFTFAVSALNAYNNTQTEPELGEERPTPPTALILPIPTSDTQEVIIYNIYGVLVARSTNHAAALASLPSGVYFLISPHTHKSSKLILH